MSEVPAPPTVQPPPQPQPTTTGSESKNNDDKANLKTLDLKWMGVGGKEGNIPTSLADEDEAFLNGATVPTNNSENALDNATSDSERMSILLEKELALAAIKATKR